MEYCYVLYSKAIKRYYTGITTENPEDRLKKHIEKHYQGQHFTRAGNDWELFLLIKCSSLKQARLIEKNIKKMKSKKYIENLKKYPEMIEKLLKKYS